MTQVLQDMVDQLANFLPTPVGEIPAASVIVLSLNDAPVGLGNFIGSQPIGPIGFTEIKGGRLEAIVRFDLWGSGSAQVNDAMLLLQGNLLGARASLWDVGFLTFQAATSASPRFDESANAWNRSADYRLLYEYQYEDTAGEGLISRIPIRVDQELVTENMLITGEMARWDDTSALRLSVRGPATFRNLSALAFVASALPGGAVTITRTHDGATDPIQDFPNLDDFLTALADPPTPQRHARVVFASLTDFLAQFTPTGATLNLGDWNLDSLPDQYVSLERALVPPIQLLNRVDRLEVTYADGNVPFDQVAVLYLKLIH
jgi:hypothetical protein